MKGTNSLRRQIQYESQPASNVQKREILWQND